jgi:hypothetical protein
VMVASDSYVQVGSLNLNTAELQATAKQKRMDG